MTLRICARRFEGMTWYSTTVKTKYTNFEMRGEKTPSEVEVCSRCKPFSQINVLLIYLPTLSISDTALLSDHHPSGRSEATKVKSSLAFLGGWCYGDTFSHRRGVSVQSLLPYAPAWPFSKACCPSCEIKSRKVWSRLLLEYCSSAWYCSH